MPSLTDVNPLPVQDANGGALNLTRFAGLGAALVALLVTINKSWNVIFGGDTPNWAKTVVFIAAIGSFTLIAASDIIGRGYAAGRRGDVIPMPTGLAATYKPGTNERAKVTVTAVRFRRAEDDSSEFLIVKEDDSTAWVGRDELDFPSGEPSPSHRRGRGH